MMTSSRASGSTVSGSSSHWRAPGQSPAISAASAAVPLRSTVHADLPEVPRDGGRVATLDHGPAGIVVEEGVHEERPRPQLGVERAVLVRQPAAPASRTPDSMLRARRQQHRALRRERVDDDVDQAVRLGDLQRAVGPHERLADSAPWRDRTEAARAATSAATAGSPRSSSNRSIRGASVSAASMADPNDVWAKARFARARAASPAGPPARSAPRQPRAARRHRRGGRDGSAIRPARSSSGRRSGVVGGHLDGLAEVGDRLERASRAPAARSAAACRAIRAWIAMARPRVPRRRSGRPPCSASPARRPAPRRPEPRSGGQPRGGGCGGRASRASRRRPRAAAPARSRTGRAPGDRGSVSSSRISRRTRSRRRGSRAAARCPRPPQRLERERLAEHRGVLDQGPGVGLEAVEARGHQRAQRARDLDRAEVAHGHVHAVPFLQAPVRDQHPDRLHGVQRDAVRALEDRRHGGLGQPRDEAGEQRPHLAVGQRPQRQRGRSARTAPRGPSVLELRRARVRIEDRVVPAPLQEVLDEVEEAFVGPLEVLEDEDDGALLGDPLEERPPAGEEPSRPPGGGIVHAEQGEQAGLDRARGPSGPDVRRAPRRRRRAWSPRRRPR